MHPWHDCYLDDKLIGKTFPVVIEIPKGSKSSKLFRDATGIWDGVLDLQTNNRGTHQ
jgi:hypothetical protein